MPKLFRLALGAALLIPVMPIQAMAEYEPYVTVYPSGYYDFFTSKSVAQAQQDLAKIPGGASVVPAKEFRNTYALNMKDMLKNEPGVYAQPRFGEEVRLSIRGSGLSRSFHLRGISMLQDGVPFNFSDGSGDFQEIDPLMIQHVEVYRGANALRYGTATLGGAVNVVTPTGQTEPDQNTVRMEIGSYATRRIHASTARSWRNSDVYAAATKSLSDGFRQQSDQDNTRFNGNIGLRLSPVAETRFYATWNDINQEVPGTLSRFDAIHNPAHVPAINITDDYARDIRSLRLANKTMLHLDNDWRLSFGGYLNDKSLYHPIFQVIDQDSLDSGLFLRNEGHWSLGEATFGINASNGVIDAKRFVNNGGHRGALTADSKQIARNVELYAENRFHMMDELALITGLQAFWSYRDYNDRLVPAASADADFTGLNPKLGLMFEPRKTLQIFGNISRSAEPPTFSELVQAPVAGFVPLKEQTAWTAEAGTRGQYQAFGWDVTAYRSWIEDEMLQFTVGGNIPASTFNAGKTIHQGIEAGFEWQAASNILTSLDTITPRLTYTLNDFYFEDDDQYGDNALAGIPQHQIQLALRYDNPSGFFIEPNVEWVPKGGYVDYANTLKGTSYTVVNLNAGAGLNPGVSVFLDARNLLDRRYTSSFGTVTNATTVVTDVFYPGEGRTLYAGFTVRF